MVNEPQKLLVVELWGVGDLAMATPFLQAAAGRWAVTLLAKGSAGALAARFFPKVKLIAATLPWTVFRHKYRLHTWPWRDLRGLGRRLRAERFDAAVSARWDPRDHALLRLSGARQRLGFGRLGSGILLTDSLARPGAMAHRYEYWRRIAAGLGIELPAREELPCPSSSGRTIFIHSGASQPTKVWPLERYQNLVARLRGLGFAVRVLGDPAQKAWWQAQGEPGVGVPENLEELIGELAGAGAFIGNDSGPGHLAALSGVPTFTIFGNQFPQRFAPLHPAAEWMEGRPCPYKPCYDHCRFAAPNCLHDLGEAEVWLRLAAFVSKHIPHG